MARKKTSIVLESEVNKLVRIRGLHHEPVLDLSRGLEAAGLMWAGPYAEEHEALERVFISGSVEDQKKIRALLTTLTKKGK